MKARLGCLVVLFLSLAAVVSAGPVAVDAGWYGFCFAGPGTAAYAGCQNSGVGVTGNSTTFTAVGPVLFKITDAFASGDNFDVNINSGAITFTTPSVPAGSSQVDPDLAYASAAFSHSAVLLGAGSYSVDVFAHDSPFGGGGAFLEVVSAQVPEPTTVLLLGLGLATLITVRRRRA